MEIFKFHTIKNAPNFCKYIYIPMMLIFLLTCLTGGIYFIVFSILSRVFALIICFVAVVAVGIVPLFGLLSAFNCELIIEENQIKYINWRRKKYTIEINYLNIVLTPTDFLKFLFERMYSIECHKYLVLLNYFYP